jgi:translation initiation factor 2 beta subunit (eIF-2beta)/eIF-5
MLLSEEYTVCRCGAKFTNDAEGKRLYELHQSWCGKQGSGRQEDAERKRYSRPRNRKE